MPVIRSVSTGVHARIEYNVLYMNANDLPAEIMPCMCELTPIKANVKQYKVGLLI